MCKTKAQAIMKKDGTMRSRTSLPILNHCSTLMLYVFETFEIMTFKT